MNKRIIIGTVVAFLVAAAGIPYVSADGFRSQIQQALEKALNRKVEISGQVRFSVFGGPGFSLADVVIHEDPAAGIEPFAYVSSLGATLNIPSLLRGRWEVSSIVLDEPTVNLVKYEGGWNVQPLLSRTSANMPGAMPEIHVRAGRLNFKNGDTKSVLYGSNADVDLTPEGDSGFRIRFEVEPARTDRAAQGFGRLSGSGRYRRPAGKPAEVDVDLDLQRSGMADIATLLEGRGADMRGFLATRAKLTGPFTNLKIEGRMRLEDIQRFDLMRAGSGNWPIYYQGTLDLPAGELDLRTRAEGEPAPFRMRLRAHSLPANPTWGAVAEFNQLPVAALREVLQYLGVPLPERGGLEGKLSGVLGYSMPHGMQGMISMPDASLKTPDVSARITGARLIVGGGEIRLTPARIDLGEGLLAEVEGSYGANAQSFTWRSSGAPLPIAAVVLNQKRLLGVNQIPGLDRFTEGLWQGAIRYEKTAEGDTVWNGGFTLRSAALPIDGLALPVKIESATGSLNNSRLMLNSIQGALGKLEFRGSYREDAGPRPNKLKLQFAEADLSVLERELLPTLKRSTGLLRTLSFRSEPAPEWLKSRKLEVEAAIASLSNGETWLGAVSGKLLWDGTAIEIPNAKWERADASASGKVSLRLTRGEPQYRVQGEVKSIAWKGGVLDAAGQLETQGTGQGLLRNAKAAGRFTGRNLALGTEADVRTLSGGYEFAAARGGLSLKLTGIELVTPLETLQGQGASETDGKLSVEVSGPGNRKLRFAGTLWPFQLEQAR